MGLDLWNNWLIIAFVAPAIWAISCIIDVCLVSERIYRSPSDGPVISGLFSALPCLIFFVESDGWDNVTSTTASPAVLAGACYFLHLHLYFKALFTINDASGIETFNNMSVLLVPMLAFVMLGEQLAPKYYVAIGLAFVGILILSRSGLSGIKRRAAVFLVHAVVCLSLVMVLEEWVFQQMGYWNGVALFAVGNLLPAILVGGIQRARRLRIMGLCRRFASLFLTTELIALIAVLASQRATDLSPSVSFVAVIECTVPAFIMLLSLGVLFISRCWKPVSSDTRHALQLQISASPTKLLSLMFIIAAILLIQPSGL